VSAEPISWKLQLYQGMAASISQIGLENQPQPQTGRPETFDWLGRSYD
jgi:hypothetical protein